MTKIVLSLAIGAVAAGIDITPMLLRKMDKTFIWSAIFMWIALGIIIPSSNITHISWINGLLVSVLSVIPILCLVTKLDKQAIPIILTTTIVLGALIGFASNLLIK